MSLWRRTLRECEGAWRSLRYDMGRRPFEPPADGPDVTSTGMNTFGWQHLDHSAIARPPRRAPRRALAVSAFGMLTVVGATTAYLAVSNGLSPSLSDAAADTAPPAPAVTTADSRVGEGPATHTRPKAHRRDAATDVPEIVVTPPPATRETPARTTRAKSPECWCTTAARAPSLAGGPPVPTPTAPRNPPSPTPSPSATRTRSSYDPSAGSSDPDDWPDLITRPAGRHRRDHG